MEAILVLVLIFFGGAIVRFIFSAGARTVGAAARTAVGSGTFSENLEIAFKGMGPIEIRFTDQKIGDNGNGIYAKVIEGKGLFPIQRTMRVGFITSVFDETSGEYEPVISAIEGFQEPDNVIYQHRIEAGEVLPDQGFASWVRLGVVLPEILHPPCSGDRKLVALLRMVDLDNPPDIMHGFRDEDAEGIIWEQILKFDYSFNDAGYQEAAQHRDEAGTLAAMIGIAVAMADGTLDEREADAIREWVRRSIEPYSDERQAKLKSAYNEAMKGAHTAAKSGNLSLSKITGRLNEIGDKTIKYEAVELCFDVMAADGVASSDEMKIIRGVAESLELDLDEIESMRDQKLIGLDTSISNQASIEDILGIEPDWEDDRIRKHLRTEFQKWNNRITTLAEGEERENCQRMLDVIGEARSKYG